MATDAARRAVGRAAADVDEMIAGDARLSPEARLDIYAEMYFFRIHDVLRDEAPRTAAVLGGAAFHDLVTDYLRACPPNHPSLREAGARLPAFLADAPARRGAPLARPSWRGSNGRASSSSTAPTPRR